jgi:hypothetical protein
MASPYRITRMSSLDVLTLMMLAALSGVITGCARGTSFNPGVDTANAGDVALFLKLHQLAFSYNPGGLQSMSMVLEVVVRNAQTKIPLSNQLRNGGSNPPRYNQQ